MTEIMRRNVKLVISYDGTDYHGWQRQDGKDLPTIQQVLEEVISGVARHPASLQASGRTDAGVHAQGQVANFFYSGVIPAHKLAMVVNAELSRLKPGRQDIFLHSSQEVPDNFDACGSAISKLYRYSVYNHLRRFPDCQRRAFYLPARVDLDLMLKAAPDLIGTHDFRSLASSLCDKKDTVRTVLRCDIYRKNHYLYFDVEGTGFLHNMVRNIVGLLLDIGQGRRPADCIPAILAAQQRAASGNRAPANGLCLQWVRY